MQQVSHRCKIRNLPIRAQDISGHGCKSRRSGLGPGYRLPHRFGEPFLADCQDVAELRQLRQLDPRQTLQILRSLAKKGLDEHT